MKIKLLFGLGGALVGSALALFYYSGCVFKKDVLACSTEFNFTRNEGKASEVKVNTVAQVYFYRDVTGVTTYQGLTGKIGSLTGPWILPGSSGTMITSLC